MSIAYIDNYWTRKKYFVHFMTDSHISDSIIMQKFPRCDNKLSYSLYTKFEQLYNLHIIW